VRRRLKRKHLARVGAPIAHLEGQPGMVGGFRDGRVGNGPYVASADRGPTTMRESVWRWKSKAAYRAGEWHACWSGSSSSGARPRRRVVTTGRSLSAATFWR